MREMFIALFAVQFALCIFFAVAFIVTKSKIKALSQSIEKFAKDGTLTEFSVSDGSFSELNNNVCELELSLIRERDYAKREICNNAEFVADISHQLKTPLAGLRLYCEMKNSDDFDSYTKKELELISKMERLIYNVLKLEKIRSDVYIMNFSEVYITDIVNELKTEYLSIFRKKRIDVCGNAELRCDKLWLREAIGNIIKNACEHTAENGRISIKIDKTEKSVCIIIEDDGGGVAEEELNLLFRRFHRSRNASPDSTGIGLAVTKAITEKHHGTVIAENGEKGLKITLSFPVIDAKQML